jgi:outer membrane immunogenic protein
MKRILSAALGVLALTRAATASDVYTGPPPLPGPVVVPTFTWTGFYIGANAGAAFQSFNITDTLTGTSFSSSTGTAFTGGGQAGFNYQISPFVVVGVDGFFDGVLKKTGISGAVIPGIGLITATVQPNWITTVAGRIGFTGPGIQDWLFYAKAGAAWVNANESVAGPLGISSGTATLTGWMAGAGIEWAFAPGWIARLDYQYIGLQDTALASDGVAPDTFTTRSSNIQTVTLGASYLFTWWGSPVGTRSW